MSNIEHIILYLLLFFLMFVWGKENYNKQSWRFCISALIPILCFAIITGCREWGVDYDLYKYKMTHPDASSVKKDEYLFLLLNKIILFLELDGTGGFIIYSIIIIIGSFIFIRSFKIYSKYMYALLLPAILIETMIHIRQGIAFGVSLIALSFLNKTNWKMFVLFSFIAFNIHSISILLLLACIVLFCLRRYIIPIWASIPMYCIAIFLPQYINYTFIQKLLVFLPVKGSKYVVYIKHMSSLFSEKANRMEWMQSPLALLLSSLFDISIIIISYWYLKKIHNPIVNIYYNIFVIGAILVRIFFLNELLRRSFTLYYMLYFVPLAYCFFWFSLENKKSKGFIVGFGCIIAYLIAYWGRFVFLNENTVFVWQ